MWTDVHSVLVFRSMTDQRAHVLNPNVVAIIACFSRKELEIYMFFSPTASGYVFRNNFLSFFDERVNVDAYVGIILFESAYLINCDRKFQS